MAGNPVGEASPRPTGDDANREPGVPTFFELSPEFRREAGVPVDAPDPHMRVQEDQATASQSFPATGRNGST